MSEKNAAVLEGLGCLLEALAVVAILLTLNYIGCLPPKNL